MKLILHFVAILLLIVIGLMWRAARAEAPYEPVYDTLFNKIAECESRFDLNAKNSKTSASGEFQFVKSTWERYAKEYWGDEWINKSVFSKDNRELAWYVYQRYGTGDWEADPTSYKCWKSAILK